MSRVLPFLLPFLLAGLLVLATAPSSRARDTLNNGPTVPGKRAVLKRGVAYAPEAAPLPVKRAIWAANALRRMPYKYGGGHGSLYDTGYDCSGTVSFALVHAGLLRAPLTSSDFMGWGVKGRGKWITVYARNGHTFMVIAGLRLDTTGPRGTEGPRWHKDARPPRGFTARRPVASEVDPGIQARG